MKRLMCVLLLLCILPGAAEQITVRNRIFKGQVSGSGDQLMVGLAAFAEAVGATLEQKDGRWVVTRPPGPAVAPAGDAQVWVEGKAVDSSGDPLQVNLHQFAAAYGLQLKSSGDTIEVAVLPRGAKTGPTEGPDLITNGRFTEGPPVGENALPAGSQAIPGWTVLSAGPWRGSSRGSYFIHLTGLSGISQDIYTTPGKEYAIQCVYYGRVKPGNDLEIATGEGKIVVQSNGREQVGWARFKASGAKTTLRLRSLFPEKGQHAVSLMSVRVAEVIPAP